MVDNGKIEEYFKFGLFIIAMIFAVISVVSLYSSVNTLIGMWFSYKYMPIFNIIFNLSILIICIFLIREKLIRKS
jgi:hypothetical protein